jgi:hypothetical protein
MGGLERTDPGMRRVSDGDRDATVQALSHHYAAGRLTMEELSERTAAAHAATTVAELGSILADLSDEAPGLGLRDPLLRLHAGLFAVSGGVLVLFWEVTRDATPAPSDEGAGSDWALWVVLVWALAVAVHAAHALGLLPGRRRRRSS